MKKEGKEQINFPFDGIFWRSVVIGIIVGFVIGFLWPDLLFHSRFLTGFLGGLLTAFLAWLAQAMGTNFVLY